MAVQAAIRRRHPQPAKSAVSTPIAALQAPCWATYCEYGGDLATLQAFLAAPAAVCNLKALRRIADGVSQSVRGLHPDQRTTATVTACLTRITDALLPSLRMVESEWWLPCQYARVGTGTLPQRVVCSPACIRPLLTAACCLQEWRPASVWQQARQLRARRQSCTASCSPTSRE